MPGAKGRCSMGTDNPAMTPDGITSSEDPDTCQLEDCSNICEIAKEIETENTQLGHSNIHSDQDNCRIKSMKQEEIILNPLYVDV